MFVGMGYDIHRLGQKRRFVLGGVEIVYSLGLLGHSDGDVLTHSIIDGILGAAGLGDIGSYFPNEERYKDISSLLLLEEINKIIRERGCKIVNIDTVVICQRPRLDRYRRLIEENLSNVLKIDIERFNLKIKTNDFLGPIGESKAVAAYTVVSLKR